MAIGSFQPMVCPLTTALRTKFLHLGSCFKKNRCSIWVTNAEIFVSMSNIRPKSTALDRTLSINSYHIRQTNHLTVNWTHNSITDRLWNAAPWRTMICWWVFVCIRPLNFSFGHTNSYEFIQVLQTIAPKWTQKFKNTNQ